MNRRERAASTPLAALRREQHRLLERRRFLLATAAGTAAPLFGLGAHATARVADRWAVLDAVQQQLFPSEADSPGAREINALDYLRFVQQDPAVPSTTRAFIVNGVDWLEDLAFKRQGHAFADRGPFVVASESSRT